MPNVLPTPQGCQPPKIVCSGPGCRIVAMNSIYGVFRDGYDAWLASDERGLWYWSCSERKGEFFSCYETAETAFKEFFPDATST